MWVAVQRLFSGWSEEQTSPSSCGIFQIMLGARFCWFTINLNETPQLSCSFPPIIYILLLCPSTSSSLQYVPAPNLISRSISESIRQFPLRTKDLRRTTGMSANYITLVTCGTGFDVMLRLMVALEFAAVGLHFM